MCAKDRGVHGEADMSMGMAGTAGIAVTVDIADMTGIVATASTAAEGERGLLTDIAIGVTEGRSVKEIARLKGTRGRSCSRV